MRSRAILPLLVGGYFMAQLDMTVLVVALPSIIRDLGATVPEGLWAVNAYVLTVAVSLITTGRLGDVLGQKRVFVCGLAVFTVFSLMCGLAQSPWQLIGARAFQGLGAALLLPQVLALIMVVFPPERRGTALGVRGAAGAGAAVAGPVIGGLLVHAYDWRAVFFINVPIGLSLLLLALVLIPDLRSGKVRRLDPIGVLLLSPALLCAVLVMTQGSAHRWNGWIVATACCAIVLMCCFVRQQSRKQHAEPLIPFALFRDRNYALMTLAGASVSMSVLSFTLILSFVLQDGHRLAPLATGALIAPASLTSMLLAPFVGRLSDRVDPKRLLLAGLVLSAVGMASLALSLGAGVTWGGIIASMVVVGAGNSMLFTPLTGIALRRVTPNVAGTASGVLGTVLQFGSLAGSAAVGLLLHGRAAADGSTGSVLTLLLLPLLALLVAALAVHSVDRPARDRSRWKISPS
ncbi:MFS transporter [Nonomuraea sp. NPDC049714]|uniref:MFS transporter n=1 Tax=Nonomuraea sp. NPDC049714 TaxID=3364357 RepID=UPI00378850AB